MEVMAWSMIMTGCALFAMLGLWMLRGGLPRVSPITNRLRRTAVASAGSHPENT
jgi:hypothetical protein